MGTKITDGSDSNQPHELCIPEISPRKKTVLVNIDKINGNNITVISLNVCGLKSKLQIPEFISMCTDYDICIFVETKCDNLDNDHVIECFKAINYIVHLQNRDNFAKHRSGGVLIAVKKSLDVNFQRILYDYNFLVVLKSSGLRFGNSKDLIIVAAYIPPYGSKYSSISMFDSLSDVLLNFDPDVFNIMICGDMNAHTLLKEDIIVVEDSMCESIGIETLSSNQLQCSSEMMELKLPIQRYNKDIKPDNSGYGTALVELCKNHKLCIYNGRACQDFGIGVETTTDKSLLDYIIGSPYILSIATSFKISDFDPLMSDRHCALSISIKYNTIHERSHSELVNQKVLSMMEYIRPKKWKPEKACDFTSNIDLANIHILLDGLNALSIDELTAEMSKIMIDSAKKTLGHRNPTGKTIAKNRIHNKAKVRFTPELQQLRKDYLKSKKANNTVHDAWSKEIMVEKGRKYKKSLRSFMKMQNINFISNLRSLKSKNPKEYWGLLQNTGKEFHSIPVNDFLEYFRDLSQDENYLQEENMNYKSPEHMKVLDTTDLNKPFTEIEIEKHIKRLKNGKSAGSDLVINEYIKYSAKQLMPLYTKLFNRIMCERRVPKNWLVGLIVPIYKNKGDRQDCNNYRGITLLSCFSKLFTSAVNERLNDFCEANGILKENQTGFRSGYSTTDHVFLLHTLIELFLSSNCSLFTAFVDFAKAFDSIPREALWYKLLKEGVAGNILDVIKSIYSDIKSCIFTNGEKSEFFASLKGVRQGENLSPLLFSLFVNDLEDFLYKGGGQTLILKGSNLHQYMKLMVIMYADDTVLLANSAEMLQTALKALEDYCNLWHLQVNCAKTKILIFRKRKIKADQYKFVYNNSTLAIVHEFKYLGVKFNYNGSFKLCIKDLCEIASRAMYALLAKSRKFNLPVDLQLELFDTLVQPIMLYNCEVWGFTNISVIEKLHLKFLKYILGVSRSTCNSIVYGELGKMPLSIKVKQRMIGYWAKLITDKESKLSHIMLTKLTEFSTNNKISIPWLNFIKHILNSCGLSYIWDTQQFNNVKWLKVTVERTLKDQFKQEWMADLYSKSSCDFYIEAKTEFCFEQYLLHDNLKVRKSICQFRTNNSKISKVIGRYRSIPRNDRICTVCNNNQVGDEFHLIIECSNPNIIKLRSKYVPEWVLIRPSVAKCAAWVKGASHNEITKVGKFLAASFEILK